MIAQTVGRVGSICALASALANLVGTSASPHGGRLWNTQTVATRELSVNVRAGFNSNHTPRLLIATCAPSSVSIPTTLTLRYTRRSSRRVDPTPRPLLV